MDYKVSVRHEYSAGPFGEVIKGTIPFVKSLVDATKSFIEAENQVSFLSPPNLLGVYRRLNIIPVGAKKCAERRVDFDKSGFDIHPSLVQIGYGDGLKPDIIYGALGNEKGRIKVVPYQLLTEVSHSLKELSDLIQQKLSDEVIDKEKFVELAKKMKTEEGLTLSEMEMLISNLEVSIFTL